MRGISKIPPPHARGSWVRDLGPHNLPWPLGRPLGFGLNDDDELIHHDEAFGRLTDLKQSLPKVSAVSELA